MKLSELTSKDVINDNDGCRLGRIIDIDFDEYGKIKSVVIGSNLLIRTFKKDRFVIEWSKIIKVGNDVIIVSVPTNNKSQKEQKT